MTIEQNQRVHRPTGSPPRAVTVAITTYRRRSVVDTLESMRPISIRGDGWRLAGILVVDNDDHPTARPLVEGLLGAGYPHPVRYVHEPTPGLTSVRNRALDEADGDVLIFIDDDEVAGPDWPDGLLRTMARTGAALVGGPRLTAFSDEPPGWVVSGRFFEQPEVPEGAHQVWLSSNNLAIDLAAVRDRNLRFDARYNFTGGEDTAFTHAAHRAGLGLRWSATATVVEEVGPDRTTLRWLLRRHRTNTANWVRIEREHDPGAFRHAIIVARGAIRICQGAATALVGATTGNRERGARGLVIGARGLGTFQGLTAHTSRTYRTAAAAPPRDRS